MAIFIKREKTNWKYILIIFILGLIVGAGSLWYTTKQEFLSQLPEIEKPEKTYNLTLNIQQEIYSLDLFPLPTTVSIYKSQLPVSPLVSQKEAERNPDNLKEAIVEFNLSPGKYVCNARFVVNGRGSEGNIDVELKNDTEKDLIINITPPP